MRDIGGTILFSATDLMRFMGCAHATALDLLRLRGQGPEPRADSEDTALLQKQGDAHEAAHLVNRPFNCVSWSSLFSCPCRGHGPFRGHGLMLMFGLGASTYAAQIRFGLQPIDRGHRNHRPGGTSQAWLQSCNLWVGSGSIRPPFLCPTQTKCHRPRCSAGSRPVFGRPQPGPSSCRSAWPA